MSEYIAFDWGGFMDRYGRFTHIPTGDTLVQQAHMDQLKWDEAQLAWFQRFPKTLVVHKQASTGAYRETGDSMGTVDEIVQRLEQRAQQSHVHG